MKTALYPKPVLLIALILNIILAFSQKPPEKFGKIETKDLKMKTCPVNSNAHAYFIFDYGNSYFEYADKKISSEIQYSPISSLTCGYIHPKWVIFFSFHVCHHSSMPHIANLSNRHSPFHQSQPYKSL